MVRALEGDYAFRLFSADRETDAAGSGVMGMANSVLGALGIWKPPDQIERERTRRRREAYSRRMTWRRRSKPTSSCKPCMNNAMHHGNDPSRYSNAQQGGWDALTPVDRPTLVKNPFQAASLYFRLRMTRQELKAEGHRDRLRAPDGRLVHYVIINQDRS